MKIGVNAGSGQRPFTSTPECQWINVDKLARPDMPTPDIVCDAAKIPMEDGALDYFVLHHTFEHAGLGEGDGMIREAHRLLKSGGALIVCVPDLRALATGWLQGKIDTITYAINLYGAYMGNDEDRHKFGYDYPLLYKCLDSAAKWGSICPFDWREIPGASIAHDWWILGVECKK